jgi:hypothetical protein
MGIHKRNCNWLRTVWENVEKTSEGVAEVTITDTVVFIHRFKILAASEFRRYRQANEVSVSSMCSMERSIAFKLPAGKRD